MSTDEQMAAIGRLTVERAEARRECALLENELSKYRIKLTNVQVGLSYTSDAAKMAALLGGCGWIDRVGRLGPDAKGACGSPSGGAADRGYRPNAA